MNALNSLGHFGSHNGSLLAELTRQYADDANAAFFRDVSDALDDALAYVGKAVYGEYLEHGFPLRDWLEGRSLPAPEYVERSAIALTCVHIFQLCQIRRMQPALNDFSGFIGHSVGLHSAVTASAAVRGGDLRTLTRTSVLYLFMILLRCHQVVRSSSMQPSAAALAQLDNGEVPTPMAAIRDVPLDVLSCLLEAYNTQAGRVVVEVSLRNSDGFYVLSGSADDLIRLRAMHRPHFSKAEAWSFLKSTLPFHSSLLLPVQNLFVADQAFVGHPVRGADLALPVYATSRFSNLQSCSDLYTEVFLEMACRSLNWSATVIGAVEALSAQQLVDFGPGMTTRYFSAQNLRGVRRAVKISAVAPLGGRNPRVAA
jgi:malonyl CoA-acyl carrier protein transacylase